MAQSNGSPRPRFDVDMLEPVRQRLRQIARDRPGADVVSAFRSLLSRLQRDPRQEGEPLYHMPKLQMTIRRHSVLPLYAEYGVHDERPVVIIRRIAAFAETAS